MGCIKHGGMDKWEKILSREIKNQGYICKMTLERLEEDKAFSVDLKKSIFED